MQNGSSPYQEHDFDAIVRDLNGMIYSNAVAGYSEMIYPFCNYLNEDEFEKICSILKNYGFTYEIYPYTNTKIMSIYW